MSRTGGVIKYRDGSASLPLAFKEHGVCCTFCSEHRTHEQILVTRFSGNKMASGKWRFKPRDIAWHWICSICKAQVEGGAS